MVKIGIMLAEAAVAPLPDPASPAAIGWACVIVVTLIIGLRQVMGFVRDLRKGEGPERRDVRIEGETTRKAEFERALEENKREHENLFSKLGGLERGTAQRMEAAISKLRDERREDATKLQDRLSKMDVSIGGLQTATEYQNQSLAQISTTMTQVLQKLKEK